MMLAAQAEALKLLDQAEAAAGDSHSVQAMLWFLRGKAATLGEEGRGSREAEALLADAVKLDPSLISAWNCLGECFWHRNELETARYTFLGALEHERNADTLFHLSMLLRTMAKNGHDPVALLAESVQLAKESVRRDTQSTRCWQGLGCAHLAVYQHMSHGAEALHLGLKALSQAARVAVVKACPAPTTATGAAHEDDAAAGAADAGTAVGASTLLGHADADLHVNHGSALFYLDQIQPALDHYGQAHKLDPSLNAAVLRQEAWEFVVRVAEFLSSKAGVKPKRLAALAAELPQPAGHVSALSQLVLGDNPARSVCVKIVAELPPQRVHHLRFVVVDVHESLMMLSVYGLPKGLVQVESTLELTAPHLLEVHAHHWEHEEQTAGFHALRIEEPRMQLKVNGCGVVPRQRPSA